MFKAIYLHLPNLDFEEISNRVYATMFSSLMTAILSIALIGSFAQTSALALSEGDHGFVSPESSSSEGDHGF